MTYDHFMARLLIGAFILSSLSFYLDFKDRPTPYDDTTATLLRADTITTDPPEMDWGRYFGLSPSHQPYIVSCTLESTP